MLKYEVGWEHGIRSYRTLQTCMLVAREARRRLELEIQHNVIYIVKCKSYPLAAKWRKN